jgi:hypothetical protein
MVQMVLTCGDVFLLLGQGKLTDARADGLKGREDTKEPLSAKFAAGDTYYWQWSVALPISTLGHIFFFGPVSILLKGDCVGRPVCLSKILLEQGPE